MVGKLDVARADGGEEDKVDKEVGEKLSLRGRENWWEWGGRNKEPAHDTCPMVTGDFNTGTLGGCMRVHGSQIDVSSPAPVITSPSLGNP